MRIFHTACILVFFCANTISETHAWGRDGHAIVADIAFEHLSSEAKDGVTMVLSKEGPGTTMGDVASWPDDILSEIRPDDEFLWSRPLHFTNTRDAKCGNPETGYINCSFVYKRDCVDVKSSKLGFCISGAISNYTKELQSGLTFGDQYSNQTLNSLKFLIHFVGDISQPLHSGMLHDFGGNTIPVDYNVVNSLNYAHNLHQVWDVGMIVNRAAFLGSRNNLEAEIKRFMGSEWKDEMHKWGEITDPNEWIQDSLDQATTKAYRFANGSQIPLRKEPVPITSSYDDAYMCSGCVVELQLAKGATRLAKLLNTIRWKN